MDLGNSLGNYRPRRFRIRFRQFALAHGQVLVSGLLLLLYFSLVDICFFFFTLVYSVEILIDVCCKTKTRAICWAEVRRFLVFFLTILFLLTIIAPDIDR